MPSARRKVRIPILGRLKAPRAVAVKKSLNIPALRTESVNRANILALDRKTKGLLDVLNSPKDCEAYFKKVNASITTCISILEQNPMPLKNYRRNLDYEITLWTELKKFIKGENPLKEIRAKMEDISTSIEGELFCLQEAELAA